jgi:hypothetical protein
MLFNDNVDFLSHVSSVTELMSMEHWCADELTREKIALKSVPVLLDVHVGKLHVGCMHTCTTAVDASY